VRAEHCKAVQLQRPFRTPEALSQSRAAGRLAECKPRAIHTKILPRVSASLETRPGAKTIGVAQRTGQRTRQDRRQTPRQEGPPVHCRPSLPGACIAATHSRPLSVALHTGQQGAVAHMGSTCADFDGVTLSNELRAVAERELGETPERRDAALASLRAKLAALPAADAPVPDDLSDAALLRALRPRKFDVARAFDLIKARSRRSHAPRSPAPRRRRVSSQSDWERAPLSRCRACRRSRGTTRNTSTPSRWRKRGRTSAASRAAASWLCCPRFRLPATAWSSQRRR